MKNSYYVPQFISFFSDNTIELERVPLPSFVAGIRMFCFDTIVYRLIKIIILNVRIRYSQSVPFSNSCSSLHGETGENQKEYRLQKWTFVSKYSFDCPG